MRFIPFFGSTDSHVRFLCKAKNSSSMTCLHRGQAKAAWKVVGSKTGYESVEDFVARATL
jgi:hypothetical protein